SHFTSHWQFRDYYICVARDPFTTHFPEVPLSRSPLIRVIAQLRFPPIVSIDKRDFIGPFQEAIRGQYPILRTEQVNNNEVTVNPEGAVSVRREEGTLWRFHDKADNWRIGLTSNGSSNGFQFRQCRGRHASA